MPILSDELSVWEIAHRWAELDPSTPRLRLPLGVRDNCRILMSAILNGEIESPSLRLDKWSPEDGEDMRRYFIRYYMDEVYACIWGKKFNRTLLRQAMIGRYEMKLWCDAHGIPAPEFWFPSGWGYEYDWKSRDRELDPIESEPAGSDSSSTVRPSTAAKITCQQIARTLWKQQPERTIADMVKDSLIQEYGGAAVYTSATVREWLSAVAPAHVKNKRGRPRKKMGGNAAPQEAPTEE